MCGGGGCYCFDHNIDVTFSVFLQNICLAPFIVLGEFVFVGACVLN